MPLTTLPVPATTATPQGELLRMMGAQSKVLSLAGITRRPLVVRMNQRDAFEADESVENSQELRQRLAHHRRVSLAVTTGDPDPNLAKVDRTHRETFVVHVLPAQVAEILG